MTSNRRKMVHGIMSGCNMVLGKTKKQHISYRKIAYEDNSIKYVYLSSTFDKYSKNITTWWGISLHHLQVDLYSYVNFKPSKGIHHFHDDACHHLIFPKEGSHWTFTVKVSVEFLFSSKGQWIDCHFVTVKSQVNKCCTKVT